jgi:putative transposase
MSQRYPEINSLPFSQQVRSTLLSILLPHLPLGIVGRNLDDALAYDILCYASVKRISIESACQTLAEAPSGNTVREHVTAALIPDREGMGGLEAQLNHTLQAQLPRPVRRRLQRCPYEVACDLVEIPYHGEAQTDEAEVRRGAAKVGTTHFHMYATLAIVHHQHRFTLALTFVWAGETMERVLDRLLDQARCLGLRVKCAYLDKGFCSVAVLRLLRQRRVPYIVPIPQRGGKNGIKQLCGGRQSCRTRYTFKRTTPQAYTTEVVIVCKYSRGRYHQPGVRYFAYAVYGIDLLNPRQVFEHYRRRFSIESGYRQLHQVRARTASRHPGLRLLLVGLALMIVNLWVILSHAWVIITRYGRRLRIISLTLEQVVDALREQLRQLLGVISVLQIRAVHQAA